MGFKERYLTESVGDTVRNNPKSSGALLGATAGGIGYGLGTGKIQQGWNNIKDMTPNQIKDNVSTTVSEKASEVGNKTIGETLSNAGHKISETLSGLFSHN